MLEFAKIYLGRGVSMRQQNNKLDYLIDANRLVAFVLFGHARKHWGSIYQAITDTAGLDIQYVQRHRFRSSRALIAALYSHDYAPLIHLRSKTRYLKKVGTDALILFGVQRESSLFVAGLGKFAHHEDRYINRLKWNIRRTYNPRESDGEMTHHHVIHATDNPGQARHLAGELHNLPLDRIMSPHGPGRILPSHLASTSLRVHQVPLQQLRVKLLPDLRVHRIEDTPHFAALAENNRQLYWEYLVPFLGDELRDGHSWQRFMALKSSFDLGARPAPIVVAPGCNGTYVVRDGAHRAALLLHAGKQTCVIAVQHNTTEELQ